MKKQSPPKKLGPAAHAARRQADSQAIRGESILEVEFPATLRVSYSRVRKWRECHRAHWYRYVRRLRKKRKSIPLLMGSVIHECIEMHHETGDYSGVLAEFRETYDKLWNEEKAELGDLPGNVEKIIARYVDHYKDDGLVYPIRRRGRKTEIPVRFWMDNRTEFVGYIDAYPQDKQKRNWLQDHKAPKRMPDEDSRFSDYQFAIYVWAAPQVGLPEPDGILWDYIKRTPPKLPETLKDGTISKRQIDSDYPTFMAEVTRVLGEGVSVGKKDPKIITPADYEEFASNLPGGRNYSGDDPFLRRIPLPNPSKELVRNTVDDFKRTVEDIRMHGPTGNDRNPTRMCKSCEYFLICAAELRGLDTEFILKSEYTEKGVPDGKETNDDGELEPADE